METNIHHEKHAAVVLLLHIGAHWKLKKIKQEEEEEVATSSATTRTRSSKVPLAAEFRQKNGRTIR